MSKRRRLSRAQRRVVDWMIRFSAWRVSRCQLRALAWRRYRAQLVVEYGEGRR